MNVSLIKLSLITAATLFLTILTALVTFGGTDFFPHSSTASFNNGISQTAETSPAIAITPDKVVQARVIDAYGNLPMSFEANQGQTDAGVKFLARGKGYSLFLTSSEAVLSLNKPVTQVSGTESSATHKADQTRRAGQERTQQDVLRMKLVGVNSSTRVVGLEELPGRSNYLIGNDPQKWRTNVVHYSRVRYEAVYRGVDMVYYGNQKQLEYDFIVAPGADPAAIKLAFEGAQAVEIDTRGDLILRTRGGEVRQHKPIIYQETGGARREVAGRYVKKRKHQVGFEVGEYDASRPLVIDPVLVYSTYLGGSVGDIGFGIAVDGAGNAYVAGSTGSTDFPTTLSSFQTTHAIGNDAFVTKLNATGSALAYSTFLGGDEEDLARGIAIDVLGQAYVTGQTDSSDFPTTPGAFDTTDNPGTDAFVAKLNANGSALAYSAYLGGSGNEVGFGLAIDAAGNAYLTGQASSNFPTTPGAFQPARAVGTCSIDAFVTKLNASGSALVYSTYLGGADCDRGAAIAVDGDGNAYVTGNTDAPNFPTTPGAFDTTLNGSFDAFVTKLNATGSALAYSTYLGGGGSDTGFGIAVDGAGNAYLTGETFSPSFPTTPGSFDTSINGSLDAFVTKLGASGAALVYSTFIGGSISDSTDVGNSIAIDGVGNAYLTGFTDSPDFPTTPSAFDASHNGNLDGFITKLDATGSALAYSTYLGGSGRDGGRGIVVDGTGNAYVIGETFSPSFPTTAGALDTSYNGNFDAFVTKLTEATPTPTPTPSITINDVFVSEPVAGTSNAVFTVTLSNASSETVTVDCQTADGTATAPADYTAIASTTLTFTPGQTNKTVTVTINADALAEGNETFNINLSNPSSNATIADSTGTGTITDPVLSGHILISEFRFRGPAYSIANGVDGRRDEYIELYNNMNASLTVSTADGSPGWTVAALSSDGMSIIPLATIPTGTVIPPRAHYLLVNSDDPINPATGGYSLDGSATPDDLYTPDIADNAGVALFTTSNSGNFMAANRLDAAGFSDLPGATASLFREGVGLTSPGANDGQYAFVRKLTTGLPQDSDDNAADFIFISTDGGIYGSAASVLGAPGPENLQSHIQRNATVKNMLLDSQAASSAPPNRVRSGTPVANGQFGTLSFRRRVRNMTGAPIIGLRFRIVDITTKSSPGAGSGQADLRGVDSSNVEVTTSNGVVTVLGTFIGQPPAQPNGGGVNSTFDVVLPGGTLTPEAPLDVQLLLGVEQGGSFRFFVNTEAIISPPSAMVKSKGERSTKWRVRRHSTSAP